MSGRGVFAVDRGIWDHPIFRRQPFSEREAFIWLVSAAAYKPRRVRVGSAVIELDRGQLAHSLRHLAGLWMWPEPNVRRFLKRLKSDAMIDADSDAGATRVTICNYDRYQRVALPGDADSDAVSDAEPTQQRRKRENKEYKEDIYTSDSAPPKARKHPWPSDYRDWFWRLYPKKVEKKPAMAALDRVHASDKTPWEAIVAGIEALISHVDAQYHPAPHRWLRDERWNDEHRPRGQRAPPRPARPSYSDLARSFAEEERNGQPAHHAPNEPAAGSGDGRGTRDHPSLFERDGMGRQPSGPVIDVEFRRSEH